MRVVWAMNLAPPYRLPVWDALSQRVDLAIWLLAANEHNRRWSVPDATPYCVRLLRTAGLRRGESVHYVLTDRISAKRPKPDVVILPGWDSPAAWQLMLWAKRRGVRTLAFNESTVESQHHRHGLVHRARGWFFRQADGVLTVSPGSTEAVLAAGVPASRITQVVNAVDVQTIREAATKVNRPTGTAAHTFLFIGQLIERKRPDLVIEAFARMEDDSRLVIAGEGPMAAQLHNLVRRLRLGQGVEFLEYVQPSDLPATLGRCDTLVVPSQEEVYGLVVTEALAAGLHVVVSERAGVAGVVRDMPGTWIVAPQLEPLVKGMRASAEGWSGPVRVPGVLGHTPSAMATAIADAAHLALAADHKVTRSAR
jgi:glycosyltransferase involved in cell wall biosynthesis